MSQPILDTGIFLFLLGQPGPFVDPDASAGGGTGGAGIVGTGSPEGIVTAEPGTSYFDNTTPGQVHEWVKLSGSGNTGWEQIT